MKVSPEFGMQLAVLSPSTISWVAGKVYSTITLSVEVVFVTSLCESISGGVVSSIVISCIAVAELPEASVAVHVIVVVPTGNDSCASFVTKGEESTMSVEVAVPRSTVVNEPVASIIIGPGAVMSGAVVSTISIVNELEPVLPAESVAVHVTVVRLGGNVSPELKSHDAAIGPSILSDAVASKITSAPDELVASKPRISAGTVTSGAVLSTVKTASESSWAVSVASNALILIKYWLPSPASNVVSTLYEPVFPGFATHTQSAPLFTLYSKSIVNV